MEFTAQQIADYLKGCVVGDPTAKVCNFSKIEEGVPGTITFLANPKYEHFIYTTQASVVLVNNDFAPSAYVKPTMIKVPNAYASLAALLNLAEQSKAKKSGVDPSACIAASASLEKSDDIYVGAFACIGANAHIGQNAKIYPHVYIGDDVQIGENVILYPHVTIYDGCIIGNNCIIHAGAVIGADGFGFAPDEGGEYSKIAQLGNVLIEDDVEIGANTTIDRAVMGSTIIRKGVKLDNLIQIAHNVEIGANTVMAAQTGIAGSTKIGDNCMFGGQTGAAGHIHIGNNAQFGAQSGIVGNVKANSKLMGSPAMPISTFLRSSVIIEKLPELYRTINKLQKEIEEMKSHHG